MPDAPRVHEQLIARQRLWASQSEIELGDPEHVLRWQDNLTATAATATADELARAGLVPAHGGKPAPLTALGSGIALAANFFGPFLGRETALGGAAGALGPVERVRFAVPLDAQGDAATGTQADLLIEAADVRPTAVLPLFAEPFADVDTGGRAMAEAEDWNGLHGCVQLARELLRANPRRFRRLSVGRALELARAMTRRFGQHGFRLAVLWYAAPGHAGRRLRDEIAQLRMRIGGEVDFLSATWQGLFEQLRSGPLGDHAPALEARYFARSTAENDGNRGGAGPPARWRVTLLTGSAYHRRAGEHAC